MSKQQTDNDELGFTYKVSLRLESIEGIKKELRVLDTYHGHGHIWQRVKDEHGGKINITGIDNRDDKTEAYMKGDNKKFLVNMDFSRYDLIDIDAYGSPFEILELIFKANYKGIVHATFIQSSMGRLNNEFLYRLGYTPAMIKKCPTLFSKDGFGKMCEYLALNGVLDISYLDIGRKFYFYFLLG